MKILCTLLLAAALLPAGQWKQLFNGKDMDGWKMVGPDEFVVENGALKTVGGMGLLYYEREKFGNCTLRIVYKVMPGRGNSGVFIRLPEHPADPWYAVHNGYEVQIDMADDKWHSTGAIYSMAKVSALPQKPPGQWNTMDIILDGGKTTSVVNGVKVMEFDPATMQVPPRKKWWEPVRGPRPDIGYVGLQNHDAKSVIYFRQVSVGPLPKR